MKFLKNKKLLIFGIIIGGIVFGNIAVKAAGNYAASQVSYTESKTVEDALNELYKNQNIFSTPYSTIGGRFNYSSNGTSQGSWTLNKGDYLVFSAITTPEWDGTRTITGCNELVALTTGYANYWEGTSNVTGYQNGRGQVRVQLAYCKINNDNTTVSIIRNLDSHLSSESDIYGKMTASVIKLAYRPTFGSQIAANQLAKRINYSASWQNIGTMTFDKGNYLIPTGGTMVDWNYQLKISGCDNVRKIDKIQYLYFYPQTGNQTYYRNARGLINGDLYYCEVSSNGRTVSVDALFEPDASIQTSVYAKIVASSIRIQ